MVYSWDFSFIILFLINISSSSLLLTVSSVALFSVFQFTTERQTAELKKNKQRIILIE